MLFRTLVAGAALALASCSPAAEPAAPEPAAPESAAPPAPAADAADAAVDTAAASLEPTGVDPVTTGVIIRGVTIPNPPPPGPSGTKVTPGHTCDFSGEEVNQQGKMEGASVQCRPNGTLANTITGLPARFNAYCVVNASSLPGAARVIQAPIKGNNNHCDLSGVSIKDATSFMGGAAWR